MAGRVHSCPVPGCSWSWREVRRPVGQGPEFDRRLAQRARMRAAILAEHCREHHRPDGSADEPSPVVERIRVDEGSMGRDGR